MHGMTLWCILYCLNYVYAPGLVVQYIVSTYCHEIQLRFLMLDIITHSSAVELFPRTRKASCLRKIHWHSSASMWATNYAHRWFSWWNNIFCFSVASSGMSFKNVGNDMMYVWTAFSISWELLALLRSLPLRGTPIASLTTRKLTLELFFALK